MLEVEISKIKPSPWQPRENFDISKLEELIASIKIHGIIEPLVVTEKEKDKYELIVGHRRLEAAKILGFEKVPIIIREAKEQEKLELALVENLQRRDLNALERARAYQKLQKEFNLSQIEIAQRIGKARATIANSLRLLDLPEEIKRALAEGKISEGQAKVILSFKTSKEQVNIYKKIIQSGLTVREIERIKSKKSFSFDEIKIEKDFELQDKETRLREVLGTKVKIEKQKEKGQIIIDFYSEEELEEIVKKIVSSINKNQMIDFEF